MKLRSFFTSLTRREWQAGDYVVGEVTFLPNKLSRIELTSDRMVEVVEEGSHHQDLDVHGEDYIGEGYRAPLEGGRASR
jgi:hypothetical protein